MCESVGTLGVSSQKQQQERLYRTQSSKEVFQTGTLLTVERTTITIISTSPLRQASCQGPSGDELKRKIQAQIQVNI